MRGGEAAVPVSPGTAASTAYGGGAFRIFALQPGRRLDLRHPRPDKARGARGDRSFALGESNLPRKTMVVAPREQRRHNHCFSGKVGFPQCKRSVTPKN